MEIEIDREKRRWLILREDGDSFETRERDEDTTESECQSHSYTQQLQHEERESQIDDKE